MNKKIFAALASATMALSATGSLAVFAEDFDVVTEADSNNGTANGVVIPDSNVKIDETNFPNAAFREQVLNGFVGYDSKDATKQYWATKKYGETLSKDEIKAATGIVLKSDVSNPKGIEIFHNLETLTCASSDKLATLDL